MNFGLPPLTYRFKCNAMIKMMHDMHGFEEKKLKIYFLENFQSNTINQGKMLIYFSHSKIWKILGCYIESI
jgi:hypothetical protein